MKKLIEPNQPTCSVIAVCRNGEWFWRLRGTENSTESSVAYATEDKAIEVGRELGKILGILPQNTEDRQNFGTNTTTNLSQKAARNVTN
jgi:hypothetical protein